jgi:hypothetical protein
MLGASKKEPLDEEKSTEVKLNDGKAASDREENIFLKIRSFLLLLYFYL